MHGERLSMADKLVLMILSENYIERKGYVWCSQKLLAEQCLCTDRGLRGIMERLERFGLVGIVHRGRQGNYYSLLFMRNVVPQTVENFEERHAVIEEAGAGIEERHALLEEQAVPHELLTVKETVDSTDQQQDFEPEEKHVSQREVSELWSEMRRVFKRKAHKSLGAGIPGRFGEKFLELVQQYGTDKVLSGFEAFVERESKDWLKKMNMPGIEFVKNADTWIDDAAITIEEPQPEQVAGPRGVGRKYAHL